MCLNVLWNREGSTTVTYYFRKQAFSPQYLFDVKCSRINASYIYIIK